MNDDAGVRPDTNSLGEAVLMSTLHVDTAFAEHFRHLKQVFLYVTDECNLRCAHCLYKPNLTLARSMPVLLAKRLLSTFRQMGAFKLTFIGGEATLYGRDKAYRPLLGLIEHARAIGYQYLRLDTNGQFDLQLLQSEAFRQLDEVSFSIDGPTAHINDAIRGPGAYARALDRLRRSIRAGMRAHVTSCVVRQNVRMAGSAVDLIDALIRFAEREAVTTANFHGVFRMGVPMDAWTEGSHIEPDEWLHAYAQITRRIQAGEYSIHVRLPQHVIRRAEFDSQPDYYGYCPCKLGERVLVHPNGIIRICSSLLSTPYGVARFDDNAIHWDTITSELRDHDLASHTPCTNQRALYRTDVVPVCFSLKPRQHEPVWEALQAEGVIAGDPSA